MSKPTVAKQFSDIALLFANLAVAFSDLSETLEARTAARAAVPEPEQKPEAPRPASDCPAIAKAKPLIPFTRTAPIAAADEPAAQPVPPTQMWTEARDEVLRDRVPAGRPTAEILAAVNALPGERVPNGSFLGGRSSALGLRRPDGWNPVTQCVDAPQPAVPPPAKSTEPYVFFTPARKAIIKRDWPAGVHADVIMQRCNDLYGKPIADSGRIAIQASALGVRRPDRFDGKRALRPEDDVANPPPPIAVEPKPISPLEPPAAGLQGQIPQPPPARPQQPAQPAQRVTFAHEAPAVRMAPAKPPLPVHAPAPKPVARPTAAAAVELPLRTPEREQRVRRGVSAGETLGQLISAVNCHPGAKMTTADLQAWIAELKLITPPKAPASGDLRTEARRRVLEAAFKVGDAYEHIATKLNALPGAHIDAKVVEAWLRELRLTRTTETPIGLLRTDFNTAMRWAIREGLQFPAGADDKTIQKIINAEREERGERLWQITEPNRPRIGIPGHAILRRKDADSHAA